MVSPSVAAAHQDLMAIGSSLVDSTVSTRAHLGWGAGPHQCPTAARELAGTVVATAVGRVFDHFTKVELTLPADQLPWRSGPVVRGLRLLPVRYELGAGHSAAGDPARLGPAHAAVGVPVPGPSQASRHHAKGLLAALRHLMWGTRKGS